VRNMTRLLVQPRGRVPASAVVPCGRRDLLRVRRVGRAAATGGTTLRSSLNGAMITRVM